MTREEEIEKEAHRISQNGDEYRSFIQGAEWADETMIEKAKKWLENFLEKTIQKPSVNDDYTSDTIDLVESKRRRLIEEVLYDFKKTMEL